MGDLTPAYKGQVKSIKRGVGLIDKSFVVVEDLLTASDIDADVVWNMTTKAGADYSYDPVSSIVTLTGKNSAGAQKNIRMKIILESKDASPDGISVSCVPVSDYLQPFETVADKHWFLRINYNVKAGATQRMTVYMLPENISLYTTAPNFIR